MAADAVDVESNPIFSKHILEPCSIYVHDLHLASNFHLKQGVEPIGWEHNQYATELWLQRALRQHPWRVATPDAADIIFVAANLSLYCVVSMYKQRSLWMKLQRFHDC